MHMASLHPDAFIWPTVVEPMRPATFAQILITPIDTAAADADIDMVGNTQKGGGQKYAQKPIRHSQIMISPNG